MHLIDQTTKDKIHPFVIKAVAPMTPIHYETIKFIKDYVVIDMFAQEHVGGWNCISKHLLVTGKLVNNQIDVVEVRPINNMNFRAPLPCSNTNINTYTLKQCDWVNKYPLTKRNLYNPKINGKQIQDIIYEKRNDDLRYRNPN